jgi:hypothetical protein
MQRCFLPKLLLISLFVVVIASPIYAQHPNTVGIWLFDEGEDNQVMDSSENGHDGVAVGGDLQWEEGKFGSAVKVSPGGAYVEVAHTADLSLETFTVAVWVMFINDTGSGEQNIAYKQVGDDRVTRNYTVKMWDGLIWAAFASGGNTDIVELGSQTNVVDGEWHHIALTYDKKMAKLYIDGAVEDEVGLSEIPETNEAPLRIGAGMDGLIDELQILSVALSAEEVKSDMNNGITTAVEPVGSLSTTWGLIKSGH